MKKILLLLVLLFIPISVFAETDEYYIEYPSNVDLYTNFYYYLNYRYSDMLILKYFNINNSFTGDDLYLDINDNIRGDLPFISKAVKRIKIRKNSNNILLGVDYDDPIVLDFNDSIYDNNYISLEYLNKIIETNTVIKCDGELCYNSDKSKLLFTYKNKEIVLSDDVNSDDNIEVNIDNIKFGNEYDNYLKFDKMNIIFKYDDEVLVEMENPKTSSKNITNTIAIIFLIIGGLFIIRGWFKKES